MQDTAQLIATILLAAFAIERLVAAAQFVLEPAPQPGDTRELRRRKLLLAALAGAIALAIVDFGAIRIVERLQPANKGSNLDYWLTWLVVVAGADRVRELLGAAAPGSAPKVQKSELPPITIVLDDGLSVKKIA
jgi:hypothetical protein